jgi:uncharacterized protein YqgC (DUF456 family)
MPDPLTVRPGAEIVDETWRARRRAGSVAGRWGTLIGMLGGLDQPLLARGLEASATARPMSAGS